MYNQIDNILDTRLNSLNFSITMQFFCFLTTKDIQFYTLKEGGSGLDIDV